MALRPFRNRLAGPALLLQLFGTFIGSLGLVLCVETAGHVALEDHAATIRCCKPFRSSATATVEGGSGLCSSAGCVDTPLGGFALKQATSGLSLSDVTMALAPVIGCPPFDVSTVHTHWNREQPPDNDRTLRSVVLLI